MVYDALIADGADELVLETLGMSYLIGVIDHSRAAESFIAYPEIVIGLFWGWSYVNNEDTQELVSDLFVSGVRNATTTQLDVLVSLICVSQRRNNYNYSVPAPVFLWPHWI